MNDKKISDFLFEVASLKRTPRTGYQFLGRGHENVAEHSFGVAMLAWVLGRMSGEADLERLLSMAIFHDLAEARTGDLNYVNKRYVIPLEEQAFSDAARDLPFEKELLEIKNEWLESESLEAKLASDADQLDMMIELRRLSAHGWNQAGEWLVYAEKRLKTREGQALAKEILSSDPDGWWFERRDELWVNPKTVENGAQTQENACNHKLKTKTKAKIKTNNRPKTIKDRQNRQKDAQVKKLDSAKAAKEIDASGSAETVGKVKKEKAKKEEVKTEKIKKEKVKKAKANKPESGKSKANKSKAKKSKANKSWPNKSEAINSKVGKSATNSSRPNRPAQRKRL
ncbi:MAG: HD domain-containing protein [Deltaproteobacteria bacterium]|jgi:putative hydrolase of HD superfamily|nr:HD domain-containing protein [Deltaproteobacteria bacterium]